MKRKVFALILVLSLIMAFGLVGCGTNMPFSNYDLSEYVKVGKYKGLEVNKTAVSVSNEEVQTKVKANVEASKSTEKVTTGKVAKGDNANIDYAGKIGGKAFDGGTATGYDLTIGSGTFIPGFEDKLIGKTIGSTSDIKVTFPKDYGTADLAGKEAVFTVKINHVSKDIVPTYNEAWIAKNSKVSTKAEYEKQVKADLIKEKEEEAENTQISTLMQEVIDKSKVTKYPDQELKDTVTRLNKQVDETAKQYSVETKDLWSQYGAQTQEEFDQIIEDAAKEELKQYMVVMAIADKEKIEGTTEEADKIKKEIEDSKKSYVDQSQGTEKEFDELFKIQYGYNADTYAEIAATTQAVSKFVLKNAKQVDKKN